MDTEAGTLLLGTTEIGELHLLDVRTRNTMLRLSHLGARVRAATITPDLKYLVLAMRDGDLQVVELERQEKVGLSNLRRQPRV